MTMATMTGIRRLVAFCGGVLACAAICSASPEPAAVTTIPIDRLYRQAQLYYHQGNYEAALPLLRQAWARSPESPLVRGKRLAIIDEIGRIYLRERQDPEGAIASFGTLASAVALTEAEQDTLAEWTSAAQEWQKLGALPDKIESADQLFALGRKYHDEALTKRRQEGTVGTAQLHIAASYLVPFIVHYDSDARIGQALFMMGEIRSYTFPDPDYWVQNFYLKEVIRRFPHTPLALQAWERMRDEVAVNYSGSGGDVRPPSVVKMVETYRQLAEPQ